MEHYTGMEKYEGPPDFPRKIYSILTDICNILFTSTCTINISSSIAQ